MICPSDRQKIAGLIKEAVAAGATEARACKVVGITDRVLRKWRKAKSQVDGRCREARATQNRAPSPRALSEEERRRVMQRVNEPDLANLCFTQAYWRMLDNGEYYCSLRTLYRLAAKEKQNARRVRTRKRTCPVKPAAQCATGPNQVWTWDITYMQDASHTGRFFYGYVIVDIFSRYAISAEIYPADNAEYAREFLDNAFKKYRITPRQLVLHSDNGSSMKAASTLALLASRGVTFSHSRPRVSNDNPFSESFFRTLKYTGLKRYPCGGFETIEEARQWLADYTKLYNEEHYHCGIKNVAPATRHAGKDAEVLEKRRLVLEKARERHPERWINGRVQDCDPAGPVWLNRDTGVAGKAPPSVDAAHGEAL